ncbi:MAG: SDR family oxidoreductase [Woeseiaceae bacterium]|nr:SDR family oxidoreductase [Woeseiaceae bacterium]
MATYLVTGCNRGIGLELVRQLVARGDDVLAVCRQSSDALDATGAEVLAGIDIGQGADMEKLKAAVSDRRIDVLLNNAGILRGDAFGELDYDGMIEQFRVNTLGPLRVTESLSDNLAEGSKVVIVTSRVGSIEDNGSGGNYGYRASKAAVNMVGTNLKIEFLPRGIAVGLLHPGLVATDMTGGHGIDPVVSAEGLIQRIEELSLENSGGFWHAEGYELPW